MRQPSRFLRGFGLAVALTVVLAALVPAATAAPPLTGPNAQAVKALTSADPVWTGVTTLSRFTGRKGRYLTHAGPPTDFAHASGPIRGAVIAQILAHRWATTPAAARRLAPSIPLVTNHELGGVGGMAGVVASDQLVYVVRDRTSGKRAYSVNEMDAYYGDFSPAAVAQLRRWQRTVMPALGRALRHVHGVALNPVMARGYAMGDDEHCRQDAVTAGLEEALFPAITATSPRRVAAAVQAELAAFPHLLGLGVTMAAGKAATRAAEGVGGSSVITVIARNGHETGLQISAFPGRWFTAPADVIALVPIPGAEGVPVSRDLGDSAVREAVGAGAGAAAAAAYTPLAAEVGLTPDQMIATSRRQATISLATDGRFPILQLGSDGALAVGLDVRRIVRTGTVPRIFTAAAPAIARPEPGFLGLGISEVPLAAAEQAVAALAAA
jgi:hypothetical protein